jgi:uncharacterized protein (DUF488 family)
MRESVQPGVIWTIGHSTHTIETFISILKSVQIECIADIRSYPGSRKFPHFNREALEATLPENNISYIHLKDLGGRRKVKPDSVNTNWHHPAFRGYADYMETDSFKEAVKELEYLASVRRTAYMCSEALWWRCHRSLVSDRLKLRGWTVLHISGVGKTREHSYTSASRIINGELLYSPQP